MSGHTERGRNSGALPPHTTLSYLLLRFQLQLRDQPAHGSSAPPNISATLLSHLLLRFQLQLRDHPAHGSGTAAGRIGPLGEERQLIGVKDV